MLPIVPYGPYSVRLLLHLRVPGRFCLDRALPDSIPLYTAGQTKFKSKTGKLVITLSVPPSDGGAAKPAAAAGAQVPAGAGAGAPPSEGRGAAAASRPAFDEGRLVKSTTEWDELMAAEGDDPFAERERIDAELDAELSSMRRRAAGAPPAPP